MTNDDVARDARSVACADAPGRDTDIELPAHAHPCMGLTELAKLLEEHNGLWHHDGRLKYLTVLIDTRGPRFNLRDRDDRSITMGRIKKAASGKLAKTMEMPAARSESEDTQTRATPSQADVDALVKAVNRLGGHVGYLLSNTEPHPDDDSAIQENNGFVRMRSMIADVRDALEGIPAALTPFQKG